GGHAAQPRALLRAGVVRLVHAVLVRALLGRGPALRTRAGARTARRPRAPAGAHAPAGAGTHVLRARAGRGGAAAKRAQAFSRGFRTAYQRRALPVEVRHGDDLHRSGAAHGTGW